MQHVADPRPVILLRADADAAIGTGHAMRVLATGESLVDAGCHVHLVSAALPAGLAERFRSAGIAVHAPRVVPGSTEDAAALRALAVEVGARGLVLDGYRFDGRWRAEVAERLAVAAFDDPGGDFPLHADVVINAAPEATAADYVRRAPGAELLLGPAFAPLRREIREAAGMPRIPVEDRRDMLVMFGGSDPAGLTLPVMERLAPRLADAERLIVAVGAGNAAAPAIVEAAQRWPERVEVHVDSRHLGALMLRARLAVSAAGTTVGELAALAVPALVVVVVDNQDEAAHQAGTLGWCRVIDGRCADASSAVAETALRLWNDTATIGRMADSAAGLVDGQGAPRIAAALLRAVERRVLDLGATVARA